MVKKGRCVWNRTFLLGSTVWNYNVSIYTSNSRNPHWHSINAKFNFKNFQNLIVYSITLTSQNIPSSVPCQARDIPRGTHRGRLQAAKQIMTNKLCK